MCVKFSHCICHQLELAIKQDDTKELKEVFNNYYINEIYEFLLEAYALVDNSDSNQFANELSELVKNYLVSTSPNSINVQNERLKKKFMDLYDDNIDDLNSAKKPLTEKLTMIIQDVQHLVYQNCSSVDVFKNCLEKIDKEHDSATQHISDMSDKKPRFRMGCTVL